MKMSETPKRPEDMSVDFYNACISITAKRARTVINHILKHGFITTEELTDVYGYDHPPRAARDVRENGIPLDTFNAVSGKTGRSIGAYRFGNPAEMVLGRIGGRKPFSKQFKERLISHYGSRSMLTNEPLDSRYLQIDHRIPYEVAGNDADEIVENYMLLDASAQRAKSWSCEGCENFKNIKNAAICNSCFWAYPEGYTHVAMRQERRLDVAWLGEECGIYDHFAQEARARNFTEQALLKYLVLRYLGSLG